jgi:D-glycero-D-manno-heptose 1,7-bisphosphate phosphatase
VRDWPPTPEPAFDVAVFLDRDGTINNDTHYPHRIEDLVILPGVIDALRTLAGFPVHVIAVTNQAGIALSLFTKDDMSRFNQTIRERVEDGGGRIDGFYYCPHREPKDLIPGEEPCPCAKPAPGMLIEAAADFCVDLTRSYMVGDKTSDVEAGRAAGCKAILVLSGKAGQEKGALNVKPDLIVDNLASAIEEIVKTLGHC